MRIAAEIFEGRFVRGVFLWHITSEASNKVPGYPLEIFDFASGSGSYCGSSFDGLYADCSALSRSLSAAISAFICVINSASFRSHSSLVLA